jgi:SulP family sulfate permease
LKQGQDNGMPSSNTDAKDLRWPILQGILPLTGTQVPVDIIAGITLAALAIPEVMGYTKIAGMPVVTGLYTILIPMAVYAFFGSSRHLVVGADSATAAIMAAGLVGLASTGSAEYVGYAGLLAIMAAALLFLARIARLGFVADFLSRTALIGFLTGVGVQVAIGEVSGMLGIQGGGGDPIRTLIADLQQIPQANFYTVGVSLAVMLVIASARRINKKIPGALIAVIGAILASNLLDLSSYGVKVLGPVPGGLPKIAVPTASLDSGLVIQLLPVTFSMFVVILTQSAATSRAYAARYNESFRENIDLVGLGLANIGAALSGAFVVNGSPTKTQMVDGAGGRSQVAQITTVLIVLLVLLFLTGPLASMPEAVLSTVVFLIGIELVDIKGMRAVLAQRPVEFWVALITSAVVVFVGVEDGILVAILISLLAHTRHGYKPQNVILIGELDRLRSVPITSPAQVLPGLILYRFNHSMYYANTEQLYGQVLDLIKSAAAPIHWLCIDMTAVDDVDFTAAATLRQLQHELKERGTRLVFAGLNAPVRAELDRSKITSLVGAEAYFMELDDVLEAYRKKLLSDS